MLKRILFLILFLAVAGNAEYMTDYTSKYRTYGPWTMTEHKIYWWTPNDTDDVAEWCDSAGPDSTWFLDTLYSRWIRLPDEADAYVCLFRMTEADTAFGTDLNDSLFANVQTTNDLSDDPITDSLVNLTAILTDTSSTFTKTYVQPDSFKTGSYIWGKYVRARILKSVFIVPDSCKAALHRAEKCPGRTTIEFWVLPLDTYP